MEVEEDQIEDDLEIVASPREARPADAVASKASGRRISQWLATFCTRLSLQLSALGSLT